MEGWAGPAGQPTYDLTSIGDETGFFVVAPPAAQCGCSAGDKRADDKRQGSDQGEGGAGLSGCIGGFLRMPRPMIISCQKYE